MNRMFPTTSSVIEKLKAGEKPPRAAMRAPFAAVTLAEGGNSNDSKTIKVDLKARQRGPIQHWYWGTVWHDLGSYRTKGPKVALDDTHDAPVGHGRPYLSEYGLQIDGVLTPRTDCPEHPSNDVVHYLRSGIPMEASIDFSGEYDIVEVPEGFSMPCNGMSAIGPCLVIQNWPLRAVAICKEGADPSTSTELATALKDGEEFGPAPRIITQCSSPAAPVQAAPAVDTKPAVDGAKAPEAKPTQETIMSAEVKPAPAAPAAPTTLSTPAVVAPTVATPGDNVVSTPAPAPAVETPKVEATPAAPVAATQSSAPAPQPVAAAVATAKPADEKPVEGAKAPEVASVEAKPAELKSDQPSAVSVQPKAESGKPTAESSAKPNAPTALEVENADLKQKLTQANAEILELKNRLEAAGTGAPAVPKGAPDTATASPMKWSELVEEVRKSMPKDATGPEVLAEAIRRHPAEAKRARSTQQPKK